MAKQTLGPRDGEFLLSEAGGTRSREQITVASGQDLEPGAVLGRVAASGEYAAWDPAATDGSETVAAINYARAYAGGGAAEALAIARDAEVSADLLVWRGALSGAEKDAGADGLRNLNIHPRT